MLKAKFIKKQKLLILIAGISLGSVIAPASEVKAAGLTAERWATIPQGQPGQPEGLTADANGNVYTASFTFGPNNIYVFGPDGQPETITPLPTGVVPLGNLIVGNKFYQLDVFNGDVLEYDLPITNTSTPTQTYDVCGGFFSANDFCALNQLDVGPDGQLYISDNAALDFGQTNGRIFRLDTATRTSSVFLDNPVLDPINPDNFVPFGVNGVTFSPDGSALFLANMNTSSIYKLTVNNCFSAAGCEADTLSLFAQGGSINGPDNIDFDNQGRLWIASGQNNQIVALNSQGQEALVVGDFLGFSADNAPINLLQPSGIVFNAFLNSIIIGNESNTTLVDPAFAATWPSPLTFTLAQFNLATVPEPASTLGLLALGLVGIGSVIKRTKSSK